MNLTWSFSTLGCADFSLNEIANLAHRFNLQHVELRAVEDRMDLPVLFKEQFGTPAKLKEWLDSRSLKVIALDSVAKLVGGSQAARDELVEMARWANQIDCPYLRVFDGGKYGSQLSKEDLDGCLEFMSWWRETQKSEDLACDIVIETHDCLTTTESILALEEALGDAPVKMLWDTHHTWKKAGEDPLKTWESIKPYVYHVHVKDSISRPVNEYSFTYVAPGTGEFALEAVLKRLEEDNYDGVVCLEWEKKWHPYLLPLETALQRSRDLGWL